MEPLLAWACERYGVPPARSLLARVGFACDGWAWRGSAFANDGDFVITRVVQQRLFVVKVVDRCMGFICCSACCTFLFAGGVFVAFLTFLAIFSGRRCSCAAVVVSVSRCKLVRL